MCESPKSSRRLMDGLTASDNGLVKLEALATAKRYMYVSPLAEMLLNGIISTESDAVTIRCFAVFFRKMTEKESTWATWAQATIAFLSDARCCERASLRLVQVFGTAVRMHFLSCLGFAFAFLVAVQAGEPAKRVAVIGEGVIGISSALALIERDPTLNMTVFHDVPFEETVSWGPAGLFRVDNYEDKIYAKRSFPRYAKIFREVGGSQSGVNLVSGHIVSTNLTELVGQDEIYGDIVYNFHYLRDDEMQQFAPQEEEGHLHAIHYTAYTTEGGKYVPWMKKQLLERGIPFVKRHINSLSELYPDFDVIVNCAGLNGGKVAGDGDDKNMYPIRGVIFEVNAPWQNHFFFKNFVTFTIPTTEKVFIGTAKQPGRNDLEITKDDREDILGRYYKLQPAIQNATILGGWSGLRPGRQGGVRLEMTTVHYPVPVSEASYKKERIIQIVHNYGHAGHGFAISWGCGETVADLVLGNSTATS